GAMLYIDLDDFKRINDRYGHPTGDALLKHAAARMAEIAEPKDVLARIGGDEFALLVEEIADTGQAVALAERLLAALSQPFTVREHSLRVHASVGISSFDGSELEGAAVTRRSDEAMYTAKLAGKGGVRVYSGAGEDEFAPIV
ncbi:MAG: GGDEF domain-containing protein, partial [Pseudomonadota bacterium]